MLLIYFRRVLWHNERVPRHLQLLLVVILVIKDLVFAVKIRSFIVIAFKEAALRVHQLESRTARELLLATWRNLVAARTELLLHVSSRHLFLVGRYLERFHSTCDVTWRLRYRE